MKIKQVEFYNFRIYKGHNIINLHTENDNRNIVIISGKNGFGKTTFLMSLVWCLYGQSIKDVDENYKTEIKNQGGYEKFIKNTLNRSVKDEKYFSVSITFVDINIPELPCNEIKITRCYYFDKGESLEIYVDGVENELTKELGPEYFIRDFILPIEIAKFFFFDAEKIVNLAEESDLEHKKNLSRAYSEVLGIKKYEDIKKELENLQYRLKKDSASTNEVKELKENELEIENKKIKLQENKNRINEIENSLEDLQGEINILQEKLIKEGSGITIEELNNLRIKEIEIENKLKDVHEKLKEYFEIIPFASVGKILQELKKQLVIERNENIIKFENEKITEKIDKILIELISGTNKPQNLVIDKKTLDYFETILKKYLLEDNKNTVEEINILHDFSDNQFNEFNALFSQIKDSFKGNFIKLSGDYNQLKNELNTIKRKIRDAESNQEDPLIRDLRTKKLDYEKKKENLSFEKISLRIENENLEKEIVIKSKRLEEIAKKIEISNKNKSKYELADILIHDLKRFIEKFKKLKKDTLQKRIIENINNLLHKKDFIYNVEIDIVDDYIDIILKNNNNEVLKKENLSKGEQQLYATSLLKALIDESSIDFPVFIDSPLQKFDQQHAQNIIKYIYPTISKQVIVFPLLGKEMNDAEYQILKPNISKTFLIENINPDESSFIEVNPDELFKVFKEKYGIYAN